MDVCTLIVRTISTLQACFAPERCATYPEANVKVCVPSSAMPCAEPELQYECRSPDGTVRIRNRSDLNLPKG